MSIRSVFSYIQSCVKLKKSILNPLKELEGQIVAQMNNGKLEYVNVAGSEEVKSLANAYNWMVSSFLAHKSEIEKLRTLNITDSLTSLYSHSFLHEYFNKLVAGGCGQIAVLFCDIDYFKVINDMHGHKAGNFVLKEIGKAFKEAVGESGAVFRYGGEEFVVILDDLTPEESYRAAEKIRISVMQSKEIQKSSHYCPVTISIGLAFYPGSGTDPADILEKADQAMYYAKQKGRNRCQIYDASVEKNLERNSFKRTTQEMLLNSVYLMAAAIDAKDTYADKHSESVTRYALLLADRLKLPEKEKYTLQVGAMLHDCGKICIPDDIMNEPGFLTEKDWEIIKNHTVMGSNIIRYILKTPEIESCFRYHHERWDGKGYPEGLAGESIPFFARIISIADAYHAMTSDRPYRKRLTQQEAFEQLRKNSGTQFDPELVDVFITGVSDIEEEASKITA